MSHPQPQPQISRPPRFRLMVRVAVVVALASGCSGEIGSGRAAAGAAPGGKGGTSSGMGGTGGTSDPRVSDPAHPANPDPESMADLSGTMLGKICQNPVIPKARIWRLTHDQIRNSVRAVLGLDITAAQLNAFNDGAGFLFRNEVDALRIRKADANSWLLATQDLAKLATAGLKTGGGACPDLSVGCAPKLIDALGAKLFRRPLRAEEKTRYLKLYTDTLADAMATGETAAQALISALLQSPYFLYRTELGKAVPGKPGVARLTGYEVASALSFTLWQTSPDDELMRAAGAGELDSGAGVRTQATRMVGDTRFQGFYNDMLADITRASQMTAREGADQVPDATTVMAGLQTEFQDYVKAVLGEKPTLDELFGRQQVTMSNAVAQLRNLGGTKSGTAPVTVTLPTGVAGLLSLGAVNFANSGTDHPSPVKRGLMVRERLLCAPVPPPPDSVKQQFVATGGDVVTNRQRYEKTMSPDLCNACHRLFNPLGYAFETFDQIGKYRTQDNGRTVDTSGAVIETRDANVSFANLADLSRGLAASQQVSECFALQGFRFVTGRLESDGDLCYVSQAHDAFARDGHNLRTLAIELTASDAFALRTVEN